MKSSLCTMSAIIVNEQLQIGETFGMVLHRVPKGFRAPGLRP